MKVLCAGRWKLTLYAKIILKCMYSVHARFMYIYLMIMTPTQHKITFNIPSTWLNSKTEQTTNRGPDTSQTQPS